MSQGSEPQIVTIVQQSKPRQQHS